MLHKLKQLFVPDVSSEPDVAAIEWAHQNELSPDLWKLEQFIRQAIFVPDDMMAKGVNHRLIKDVINGPVYDDVYTAKPYTFWKKDLGGSSFPIILPADYRPDAYTIVPVEAAPIKGELYYIPGGHFKELDKYKLNGLQFYRDRIPIRIPYRTVRHGKNIHGFNKPLPQISNHNTFHTIDAWAYLGIQEYWDPMIGGIFKSQMDLYEHDVPRVWIDKYYKFETG